MVKVRKDSNENLAPDQLPPVAGINLSLERLQHLRRVTFKAEAAETSKRVRKPKRQA